MSLHVPTDILGVGIIVAVVGGLAAVWYLRKKGYREAGKRERER